MPPEFPEFSVPAIRTPRKALYEFRDAIIPVDTAPGTVADLIIRTDQNDLNVRELSAYLSFVDRMYGRLTPQGLHSYAQRREVQVRFDSIRTGSLEMVISEVVANSEGVTRLIILYLLLKHLPTGLATTATAYRDYEEGRLARERRKQLREQVQEDEELAALDRRRKNDLIRFLDTCYQQEQRQTPRVRRFSVKYVQRIVLQFRMRDGDQDADR